MSKGVKYTKNKKPNNEYYIIITIMGIIQSSQNGDINAVRIILWLGADPNIHDNDGRTALIMASEYGHIECVRVLLKAGADPNKQDIYGWTALIYASRNGYIKILKILLEADADPNKHDILWRRTALMLASEYGHTECIRTLKEHTIKELKFLWTLLSHDVTRHIVMSY